MKTKNDGIIMGSVSALLLALVIFAGFAPGLVAQEKTGLNDRYGELFTRVMDFVTSSYVEDVDPQTLFDGAMQGLFDSLEDPYTTYLSASDMSDLRDTTDGEFGGVGLYINKIPPNTLGPGDNIEDFLVEVVSPIEGTPAHRAGILAGDYISHIEGEPVNNLDIDQILERLRGRPDTDVEITVLRGLNASFDVTLTRAIIEIPTVRETMIDGDIGYLRIIQFTPHTHERVEETLKAFLDQKVAGLVIDLRSNPGGLLDSVVKTADYFFSDGVLVSTKSRVPGESYVFEASRSNQIVPDELPIVVLIDRGSASASEILAGALKDRGRAYLMGETSYGKGSVQQIYPLDGANFFKMTIARYFTPADINIDKIGIEPNEVVAEPELTDQQLENFSDLVGESAFSSFAEANPDADDSQVMAEANRLQEQGSILPERILIRLLHTELNKINNRQPPVVDLQWDTVLKAAVDRLHQGDLNIQ